MKWFAEGAEKIALLACFDFLLLRFGAFELEGWVSVGIDWEKKKEGSWVTGSFLHLPPARWTPQHRINPLDCHPICPLTMPSRPAQRQDQRHEPPLLSHPSFAHRHSPYPSSLPLFDVRRAYKYTRPSWDPQRRRGAPTLAGEAIRAAAYSPRQSIHRLASVDDLGGQQLLLISQTGRCSLQSVNVRALG